MLSPNVDPNSTVNDSPSTSLTNDNSVSGNPVGDLSLAALFGAFLRSPGPTLSALGDAFQHGRERRSTWQNASGNQYSVEEVAQPRIAYRRNAIQPMIAFSAATRSTLLYLGAMIGGWLIAMAAIVYGMRNGVNRKPGDLFPGPLLVGAVGIALFAVAALRAF